MKHILFSIILLIYSSISAAIIEIHNFREVAPYLTKNTLLILDIDDTLLIPKQMLGSDMWFQSRVEQQKALGLSPVEALEKALNEWEGIRHFTEMQLVEPGIEKIIDDLQKKGHIIMGLTTQPLTSSQITSRQLKDHQIDLTLTAPYQKSCYFQNENTAILYAYGVLFSSGTSKGKALFHLLEIIKKKYHRIVFINDKTSHLSDVAQAAQGNKTEFIGLRYAYSDFRKKAFDARIANIQLQTSGFSHILSDKEAEELLQKTDVL
jgi:hypothetical protein